jgi:hypothetical protein
MLASMATITCFLSMPLPAGRVPRPLSCLKDVSPLWEPDRGFGGSSRKDWLGNMFAKVVDDYQAGGLAHLLAEATCLSPEMIAAGIADAQAVLRRWRIDPSELIRLTGQDGWNHAEIIGFLEEPVDLSPYFDDGDCLPYLIACLKAHLHVLQVGLAEGMAVVHARSWAVR